METGVKEDNFQNSDDQRIYCRYWNEDKKQHVEKPKALVFICHGAAEHCQWYNHIAEELINIGCYVFAHDHVGHGQSEGHRMFVADFHHYVRDVFAHIDKVKSRYPSIPVFLVGHSMGGAIAILAGLEKPTYFKGIVLIAPAILPSYPPNTALERFAGRIIARLCPRARIRGVDPNGISRDPLVVKKYVEDPLVYHGKVTAKFASCFLDTMLHLEKVSNHVDFPFLTLHGTKDVLTGGSEHLFDHASSKDKSIKMYNDQLHQIHNEPDGVGEEVRGEVVRWIEERL